jgi:hypothetical protein
VPGTAPFYLWIDAMIANWALIVVTIYGGNPVWETIGIYPTQRACFAGARARSTCPRPFFPTRIARRASTGGGAYRKEQAMTDDPTVIGHARA